MIKEMMNKMLNGQNTLQSPNTGSMAMATLQQPQQAIPMYPGCIPVNPINMPQQYNQNQQQQNPKPEVIATMTAQQPQTNQRITNASIQQPNQERPIQYHPQLVVEKEVNENDSFMSEHPILTAAAVAAGFYLGYKFMSNVFSDDESSSLVNESSFDFDDLF